MEESEMEEEIEHQQSRRGRGRGRGRPRGCARGRGEENLIENPNAAENQANHEQQLEVRKSLMFI